MPRQIKLKVIPKPGSGTRIVFAPFSPEPLYIGDDGSAPDYICGNCGCVFMTKVNTLMLDNIIIKCPRCGAFNDADLHPVAPLAEGAERRLPLRRTLPGRSQGPEAL
jgi:hypothetical protein